MILIQSIIIYLLINALICVASGKESVPFDTNHEKEHRAMFEIPSAFDFYNDACEAHCDGKSTIMETNPCPKCKDKYSQEHCNYWLVIIKTDLRLFCVIF